MRLQLCLLLRVPFLIVPILLQRDVGPNVLVFCRCISQCTSPADGGFIKTKKSQTQVLTDWTCSEEIGLTFRDLSLTLDCLPPHFWRTARAQPVTAGHSNRTGFGFRLILVSLVTANQLTLHEPPNLLSFPNIDYQNFGPLKRLDS